MWSKRGVCTVILKWTGALMVLLVLLRPAQTVSAHPADMYAHDQSVSIGADGVQINWRIAPGLILADTVWEAAGPDPSGAMSPAAAKAWVTPFLTDLSVSLDGRSLGKYEVRSIHWPVTVDVLRTGEDSIGVSLHYNWPAGIAGTHALEIHNAHLEANSLNSFTLAAQSGFTFDQPAQKNGLLDTDIHFPAASGAASLAPSSALTSWSSGTPNLPDFTAAVSHLAVAISNPTRPQAQQPASTGGSISSVTAALTGLVKTNQFSPLFLMGAFILSLALGSLHALTPGHGKALVGAYLVGSQGRTRDAVFLGSVVTATHTGSVLLLGLVTLFASHYILPSLIAPWLEIVSGILVVAFGLNLLFQRRRDLRSWPATRHAAGEAPSHAHLTVDDHEHERVQADELDDHRSGAGQEQIHAATAHHHHPHAAGETHDHTHEDQVHPRAI